MLETRYISKHYRSFTACSNINIQIPTKKIIGLFGPNGAGKSTCFHIITGLVQPSSGGLFINDVDITQSPIHKRAQMGIGFLPQDSSIFRGLSVLENIRCVLELRTELSQPEKNQKLENLINRFELEKVAHTQASLVSGGQRRRTEIARALANEPKYILLDEPFAGIDPKSIREIKKLIIQVQQIDDVGILITDHNVKETLPLCNQAYVIHKGHILAEGSPQELKNNKSVIDNYLGED